MGRWIRHRSMCTSRLSRPALGLAVADGRRGHRGRAVLGARTVTFYTKGSCIVSFCCSLAACVCVCLTCKPGNVCHDLLSALKAFVARWQRVCACVSPANQGMCVMIYYRN